MTKINVKWTIITSPSCHFFHNPGYSKTPQNMCVYVILYVYKRAQFTANPISVNARYTNIFFHPSSLHDLSSYCSGLPCSLGWIACHGERQIIRNVLIWVHRFREGCKNKSEKETCRSFLIFHPLTQSSKNLMLIEM